MRVSVMAVMAAHKTPTYRSKKTNTRTIRSDAGRAAVGARVVAAFQRCRCARTNLCRNSLTSLLTSVFYRIGGRRTECDSYWPVLLFYLWDAALDGHKLGIIQRSRVNGSNSGNWQSTTGYVPQ